MIRQVKCYGRAQLLGKFRFSEQATQTMSFRTFWLRKCCYL